MLRCRPKLTFKRALSRAGDDDVEIPQVVLMRSCADTRCRVSNEPFSFLVIGNERESG